MKRRVIVIDMPGERSSRAALLVDGRLEDLLLDPPKGDKTPAPGEIYWAKVERLVPRIGGAFVALSPGQEGFLREAKGLKEGARILAQVTAYAEPSKAAPVSTRLLYKTRYLIFTPDAPGINVSSRIGNDEERERLSRIVKDEFDASVEIMIRTARDQLDKEGLYEKSGIIIRSAAEGLSEERLRTSVDALLFCHLSIHGQISVEGTSPSVPLVPVGARDIALTEWTSPPPDQLVIQDDDHPVDDDLLEKSIAPDTDPFEQYGIWDEIERLKSARVDLPSGAWMAIEATRAMVTVDVNTGAEFSGGAALTANLEAAKELPRQLRLRGLGGQITIDFAPLPKKDRKRIEEALKAAFRRDPIETTLAGWTPLGHFELLRKRERRPLSELVP